MMEAFQCQQHGLAMPRPGYRSFEMDRFTGGAYRIGHIYRLAADPMSASSFRSLPHLLLNFLFSD